MMSVSNQVSRTTSKYARNFNTETHLNLTVTELQICGKNEGYLFKFDSMNSDSPLALQFLANRSSESNLTPTKKNLSNTIINNNPDVDINLKIDKSFIPDSLNMFMLDTKKMSYVMNPKNIIEIKNNIKEEAIKKLKKEDTEKEASLLTYSDNSLSESESNLGSLDSSSIHEKNIQVKKKQNEEYFNINLYQIKFLIYDFKKDSLVEVKEQNIISQVEQKKFEDFSKQNEENPNVIINDIIITKKEIVETKEDDLNENAKENVLIKQIEYALSKEENQPTIIRMKWLSFFIFLAIITLGSLFLSLFLDSISLINENIKLIYDSYNLISNTVYSVFHTRELTLLNNPLYTNIYQNKEQYILNNTNILLNIFSESHDLLTNLITTNLPITDINDAILTNSTIKIFILEESMKIKSIDLTLSSSFLETNTALYHLANEPISQIFPTSKDIFFFLYNSLNAIYDTLFLHANIFISELTSNIDSFKYNFLIIFITSACFCFVSYFFISYAFLAVGRRKESYLEVFFEIGEGVIRNALEKCEKFSKKIQSDYIPEEEISTFNENEILDDPALLIIGTGRSNRSSGSRKRKSNN